MTETATSNTTEIRPTIIISVSEGLPRLHAGPRVRIRCHMSTVTMVEVELKTEVREDIRAAIITASISPLKPVMRVFIGEQAALLEDKL